MAINHQQLIKDSVHELSDLVRERRRLDDQINRLQRLVRTTAIRFKSSKDDGIAEMKRKESLGLTDAVRHVFALYDMELTPVMIRDLLPTIGFDTGRYKEPLTPIHAILRRLISSGVVTRMVGQDGIAVYLKRKCEGRTGLTTLNSAPPEASSD